MPTPRTFGRRSQPAPAMGKPHAARPAPRPEAPPAEAWLEIDPADQALDAELRDWKKARKRHIPWRQIYLMASLCFGIASLVLPDSVNAGVDWLLYGLAAASLYAGFARRRAKDQADAQG